MDVVRSILFCKCFIPTCYHIDPGIRNVFSFRENMLNRPYILIAVIASPKVRIDFFCLMPCLYAAKDKPCRFGILIINQAAQFAFKSLVRRRNRYQFFTNCRNCLYTTKIFYFADNIYEKLRELSCVRNVCDITANKESNKRLYNKRRCPPPL